MQSITIDSRTPRFLLLLVARLRRGLCAGCRNAAENAGQRRPRRPWSCWARPRRCRWPSRSARSRFCRCKGRSLAAESPQDFLREDSSIFLEERGAGGGQADIVLRGGSFEQTLVLLNGFRINDAQTSHHNLDLPVPLEAMDSIQVLEGAGSTLHGVDALSGVVDFLTAAPDHDSLFLRAGEGSFESNEETLLAGATRGRWSGRVTAERNFSTGFMDRPRLSQRGRVGRRAGAGLAAGHYRSAVCRKRPLLRRQPVLWPLYLVGADQGMVCLGAAGAGQPDRGGLRLSPPHRRVRALARRSRRFTKTTISMARGRRRCGAQRICPPSCSPARCC